MSPHTRADDGFGLIEAIIAVVLLAVVALAVAPILWDGLRYSTEQARVATATRQLNSIVEQARLSHDCASLLSYRGAHAAANEAQFPFSGDLAPYPVPSPDPMDPTETANCNAVPNSWTLLPGKAARLTLEAEWDGKVIAKVDAIITLPEEATADE